MRLVLLVLQVPQVSGTAIRTILFHSRPDCGLGPTRLLVVHMAFNPHLDTNRLQHQNMRGKQLCIRYNVVMAGVQVAL